MRSEYGADKKQCAFIISVSVRVSFGPHTPTIDSIKKPAQSSVLIMIRINRKSILALLKSLAIAM